MSVSQISRQAEVIESLNPNTGEVVGSVPSMSAAEVDQAVARARAASERWGALTMAQRRDELTRFRRGVAARCEELAELIHRENGKPPVDAIMEVFMGLGHLAYAIDNCERALATRKVSAGLMANFRATISYAPLGVVGVIGPWNYPLFTPFGSICYALAAGNTIVFKPSELTPLTGKLICEIAAETITVPDVLVCVTGAGPTGAALARAKVDKIAFTGSAATGKRVMQAAAENLTPVLMELGGKDAMIVADDADIDKAAEAAVWGALTNAGQACISVERCYVTTPVYQKFLDKVVAEAAKVSVGGEPDSHIGAITRPQQVDIIRDHLEDAVARGARVLTGGPKEIRGHFVPPTVLADVKEDMKVMTEETFGPVLPVIEVPNVDEAVRRANASKYGLGSAVFGKAGVRDIARRIRAGMTSINAVLAFAAIPALPFGGVGDSGFGRIHGDEGIREFARIKSTAEERFSLPVALLSFKLPKGTANNLKMMIKQLYGGGVVDRAGSALKNLFRN